MTASNSQTFDFARAKQLLERGYENTLSQEDLAAIFARRAAALAKRPEQQVDTRGVPHIRFAAADIRFAVALQHVRTIALPSWTTTIPGAPAHISRLIHIDGRIVSLTDLGSLLNLRAPQTAARPHVILLQHESTRLGVVAERVLDITSIDLNELSPSNSISKGREFVAGIGPEMTLILDARRLLAELKFDSQIQTS